MRAAASALYMFGVTLAIAPVAWTTIGAPLPISTRIGEGALLAVGLAYAAWTVRLRVHRRARRMVLTAVNALLATTVLSVAAPFLDAPLPLAFAVLSLAHTANVASARRSIADVIASTVICTAGMGVIGTVAVGSGVASVRELATWMTLLVGFDTLVIVHWHRARDELDRRIRDLVVVARAARLLGGSTDQDAVAAAVLDAFKSTYPHLDWGGLLLHEPRSNELRALAPSLGPEGIGIWQRSPAFTLLPGEGLAGEAFATDQTRIRSTAAEARADEGSRRGAVSRSISAQVGQVRSAVAAPLRSAAGRPIGVITLGSTRAEYSWEPADLTLVQMLADQAGVALERARLYDEQRRQAATDPLTGLHNRREFQRIIRDLPAPVRYAVLAIDVDNLKSLNDEYGHEAGDAALQAAATALRMAMPDGAIVARTGGDEFVGFLDASVEEEVEQVAERLREAMHGLVVPRGRVRISIGCARGGPGTAIQAVWAAADEALFCAKRAGRDRVETAGARGDAALADRQRWERMLPGLIAGRGVRSVYQPIVELESGRRIGFEALARPASADDSSGVEGLFEAALRAGVARDLDWVCRRCAVQDAALLPAGAALFVNVGVTSLLDPVHDVDQMLVLLRWAGRNPSAVVLEISEREAIRDISRLRSVIADYRAAGFRFALDDIGKGHSTLEILAEAMPEYIKLAGSLSRRTQQPGPRSTIEALITFASATGAAVIAEEVSSPDMAGQLRALGVRYGQGFALGRPARPGRWPTAEEVVGPALPVAADLGSRGPEAAVSVPAAGAVEAAARS